MQYSAVIIPTLCRDRHLKTCLESLSRCTHAEETDVFIGLDYPAKESHVAGYQKICDYLPTVTGFHSLHVIRNEKNLGSAANTFNVMKIAAQTHDSYIYMDDDCEVAPNFLDFIHKGLEKFKDDPSVCAICGYSYRNNFPCGKSNFYLQRSGFCAWGYAMTFQKRNEMLHTLTRWYSIKKILNPFTLWYSAWFAWSSFLFLFMHAIKPSLCTDYVMANYLLFEHKNMVMPKIPLVRNNGFDGSGEHCVVEKGYDTVQLDTAPTFEFIGSGMDHYWEIDRRQRLFRRSLMPFSKMCSHIRAMISVRLERKIKKFRGER